MKNLRPVSFVLEHDGEVTVNSGYVEAESKNVVAIAFDLGAKHAEISIKGILTSLISSK
jgi:hypothetical protein